ncbi:MAG: PAS domain-containing sensor histidine kinase [Desulfovibrionaceae bacterium]|jgi:PAS domain S-box-containing protein|nr:PAS domain-containing sensor histidine kinase [Desulfovibrionaceae bacterium]
MKTARLARAPRRPRRSGPPGTRPARLPRFVRPFARALAFTLTCALACTAILAASPRARAASDLPAVPQQAATSAPSQQAPAQQAPPRDVLLLNSYHAGSEWSDEITDGVREALAQAAPAARLSVEYMDTKYNTDPEYLDRLLDLYRHKFRHRRFDAVVVSDDNAFAFFLRHRAELFGDAPAAFCGLNYPEQYDLRGQDRLTGVVDHADLAGTLEGALELHPGTRTVYVVNDRTTTGQAMDRLLASVQPRFKGRVEFERLSGLSMRDLQERLAALPSDALVLLFSYVRDAAGHVYSYHESCALVCTACNRPVYGLWDVYMGHGILGGVLNSGRAQGALALRQVLRLAEGPGPVPLATNPPNVFSFDYVQMRRFGLAESGLPPGSRVANRPESPYMHNKGIIWGGTVLFLILAMAVAGLAVNTVARRRAEQELQRAERRYRDIFEHAVEGIYQITLAGRVISCNTALARLLGFDSPDQLVHELRDVRAQLYVDPRDRDRFLDILRPEGRVLGFETRFRRRDGSVIWVSVSSRLAHPCGDMESCIEGFVTDVTARKQAEEEVAALTRRLEERVQERTREFRAKTDELVAANARLQELDDLKSVFLSTVSNDLRTPLTSIIGFVKLVSRDVGKTLSDACTPEQEKLGRRIQANLEIVTREGERLARRISDFLDLSRIESGRAVWSDTTCRVDHLVEAAVEAVRPQFADRPEVELKVGLGGNLPELTVDRERMVQVLVNLLSNADRFTDNGSVTLTAWAAADAVRISVADTGMGIPAEQLESIFDTIRSADTDTLVLDRPKGTGMGLAICRAIVNHYQGRIWAESHEDRGSVFHLELPVHPAENRDENRHMDMDGSRGRKDEAHEEGASTRAGEDTAGSGGEERSAAAAGTVPTVPPSPDPSDA